MADFETLLYEEIDGVAWVTMNRPEVHNAFNLAMQAELKSVWQGMRHNDDVRCAVLTGAGEKAFCSGIDRAETMGHWTSEDDVGTSDAPVTVGGHSSTPWHFDDPGDNIGPKANDLWKPVIAAVNGMACGGAVYLLGEGGFIISAEHATFFAPPRSFCLTPCFQALHILQQMPVCENLHVSL